MALKWIPNAITLVRIGAAPFIGWLIWQATSLGFISGTPCPGYETCPQKAASLLTIAFWLFTLAAVTDWLDGALARALDAASPFGAKLDLWADKILVASVLIGFLPNRPWIAVPALLCLTVRDLLIMALRARRPDVNLKATLLAKSKTAIVMVGLALWLASFPIALHLAEGDIFAVGPSDLIIGLLGFLLTAFGCVLSLYTGWQYLAAAQRTPAPE
ncbi:MAG: CDP-alcohol phosphatidyltransferase family protein [Pseudomonadota bacterium]